MRKNAIKKPGTLSHVYQLYLVFLAPFPMPYLISLKVPAFSQYRTCWGFYVFGLKKLYTVLFGGWSPQEQWISFWAEISWFWKKKRQRGTHCSQLRRGPQDSKKGTKKRPNSEQSEPYMVHNLYSERELSIKPLLGGKIPQLSKQVFLL